MTTAPLRIWLALAVLLLANGAAARSANEFDRHVAEAQRSYADKNFDKAVEEFQAAYNLDPEPVLLLSIGRCHFLAGRPSRALDFYQQALRGKLSSSEQKEALASITRATLRLQEQQQREAQESAARQAAVQERLAQLAASQPPPPTRSPLYRKPWFWGVIGGVTATGLALGLGLGLGLRQNDSGPAPPPRPDDYIPAPSP